MQGWLVIWQNWAAERTAFVVAVLSDEARAEYPDNPEIAKLPNGQLLKMLFDADGNPLSLSCDICAAIDEAKGRSLVIAGIYRLADAMRMAGQFNAPLSREAQNT